MKALLTILSLMVITQTATAVCEIRASSGQVIGTMVNGNVFNHRGVSVGSKGVRIVKTSDSRLAGFVQKFQVPQYDGPGYSTVLIENAYGERQGQAKGTQILNERMEVLASFNSECDLIDAAASALLLLFPGR